MQNYISGHKRTVGTSREHEAKEFKDVLRAYADAWYQLYVYRIEALRPSDPLRQSLDRCKSGRVLRHGKNPKPTSSN